ncbi:hypothetical protein [uncultured Mucilaginibacter sp.]|uniref:hypothetical protein n=1 Tax=uncultured Mucilaginibacter sp. TaxID=797541 RepID=UPI002631FCD1|nr:hypothetical protein [uncultured Mucilaginibacter sp.]
MEQKKNLPEEQLNNPYSEDEGLQQTNKDGQEILDGAHETDQLDGFKKNVDEGGRAAYPDLHQGAEPSEGDK